jgi:hypothetical protein
MVTPCLTPMPRPTPLIGCRRGRGRCRSIPGETHAGIMMMNGVVLVQITIPVILIPYWPHSRRRMAGGSHGLCKVSPGPVMPDPFTLCGRANRPPLPYGRFRGGPPAGGRSAAILYPFGRPTPYAYDRTATSTACTLSLLY